MTEHARPAWAKAATLGFGLGLPLGALGVARSDPTTCAVALFAGLGLVGLALLRR